MNDKTRKLLDNMKRLVQFSGGVVEDKSITNDGVFATVNFEGQLINIFMSSKQPLKLAR